MSKLELNLKQREAYEEAVEKRKNILLTSAAGSGKCLKKDTPVIMFDGTIKKIQDIKEGELVMGDDSTSRKVLSTTIGYDKLYEVANVKGETYTCNEEHILCLKYSNKKQISLNKNSYGIRWFDNKTNKVQNKSFNFGFREEYNPEKLTQDECKIKAYKFFEDINENRDITISVKDYMLLPVSFKRYLKGYSTGIDFPEKKLDFDPYILGVWLGDGHANTSCITNQDSTILKYLRDNLSKYKCYLQFHNDFVYRINGDGYTNESKKYKNNNFLKELKEQNLLNNKHIPLVYKCNSRENRLKLLAGIIDSDGNLTYCKSSYEFTQSIEHKTLIDDIIYLCRSLGFACYKRIKNTTWTHKGEKKSGIAFRIQISGENIDEIPTLCPRKKASPRKQIKDVLVSGITVKNIGLGEYYGFELDGNHKFVLGNFIVTHNSFLLKKIKSDMEMKMNLRVGLTSTTGISSSLIGGQTLHSFLGIRLGTGSLESLFQLVSKNKAISARWKLLDVLIIDEGSMLTVDLFEKIEKIARLIRENNKPFGGIQIIISADFLQLPPVNDDKFLFESSVWDTVIDKCIYLTQIMRQKDAHFTKVLNKIRLGVVDEEAETLLKSREIVSHDENGLIPTMLFSTNAKVDKVNKEYYDKLSGEEKTYKMVMNWKKKVMYKEKYDSLIRFQNELNLKVGAQVIHLINKDQLFNGSRGVITRFQNGYPVVLFSNGIEVLVEREVLDIEENDEVIMSYKQLPLKLAYAISIHKSQGSSISLMRVDFDNIFENGQAYVGLSRITSLEGLYISNLDTLRIKAHPRAVEFYKKLLDVEIEEEFKSLSL